MTEKEEIKVQLEKEKTKVQILKEKAKNSTIRLKNEFRNAISTALIAAFGFIIALEWREVIQEMILKVTVVSPIQSKLISALIVTFISVIGIILVTSLIHKKE